MANEIRLRRNNIAGTITDNPLSNVATTINSAGFVDLPVVGGTQSLILILDPLEVNGQAEVVLVTAHTNAATSVTVTRGVEGSTPRSHPLGTTWFHGPVTSDYTEVLTSGTRPTIPYTGELIYETDTSRYQGYTGAAWQQAGLYFDPPACRVYQTALSTIATGGIETSIPFDTERYDTDNMHSTSSNTSRITFNTPGLYQMTFTVGYAGNVTGDRVAAIRLNGTTFVGYEAVRARANANGTVVCCTTTYKVAVNDYIEALVFQDSGGNLALISVGNAATEFSAVWIGRGN